MSKKKKEEEKLEEELKESEKKPEKKKEVKNTKEKDNVSSNEENKDKKDNKKRTKTDDYYDELTKENKIVDIIKEKDGEEKEEIETEEEKEKVLKAQKKITKSDMFFLNIQLFFSIGTFVLAIIYFFNKNLMFVLQIVLGLTMIVTGVNNIKVYKRKSLTVFYFALGIALLVLSVITMLGK